MSQGSFEPSAEARIFAAQLRNIYAALTDQGFSEPQALQIIGHIIASVMSSDDDGRT